MKWASRKFHADKRKGLCASLSCWSPCEMILQWLNIYMTSGEKNAPRLLNKHTEPVYFWKVPEADTVLKMCTCLVQILFSDYLILAIVKGRKVRSKTWVLNFSCWLLTILNSKITTPKVTMGVCFCLRGLWVILPGLQVALQEESHVGPVSYLLSWKCKK